MDDSQLRTGLRGTHAEDLAIPPRKRAVALWPRSEPRLGFPNRLMRERYQRRGQLGTLTDRERQIVGLVG